MTKKLTKAEKAALLALEVSQDTAIQAALDALATNVPTVDAVPAAATSSVEVAAADVAAAIEAKANECETLGAAVAHDDEGAGDRFAEGRRLGLLPAAQGEGESGADYDKRCAAFEPPKALMSAFTRGYVKTAALRTTKPFSVVILNETSGKCRDAVAGDEPTKVRTFTPVECFLMDKDAFKALPGDAKLPDTVKGRVSGSRASMQLIGHGRKCSYLSQGKDAGRIIEAATGVKAGGGKGRAGAANRTLAEKCAAFKKTAGAQCKAQGADIGLAFGAAFAAFVENLIDRKVMTAEQWTAAVASSK
jgi:hypothetical protein